MAPLNFLHVFRAPVGGLFRHVLDLTRGQIARGHRVGIIADSLTGGEHADRALRALEPSLALGLSRVAMHRQPHPGDIAAVAHVVRRAKETRADVLHGHGAKGGVFARLAFGVPSAVRVYTPHGGSLLFNNDTLAGRIYLTSERLMMPRGDLYLFESAFSADAFNRKIGRPSGLTRIVHNGVTPAEFEPVVTAADATDLIFMGELRALKGVDLLIDAVAMLRRDGRSVSATLVGAGPDQAQFHQQVERLKLGDLIHVRPPMPARQAQALGRVMVMPSRMESLPYVVLEAAAAGKPLVTTRVGGIPEIYGPLADALIPPDDVAALARAIAAALDGPAPDVTARLRDRAAKSFTIDAMVDGVVSAYAAAINNLSKTGRR